MSLRQRGVRVIIKAASLASRVSITNYLRYHKYISRVLLITHDHEKKSYIFQVLPEQASFNFSLFKKTLMKTPEWGVKCVDEIEIIDYY